MSNIIQKTDYSTGLDLLMGQYENATKLKGLIDASYDRADDLELALFEIRDEYWLSTAAGDQLDVIGSIFRVDRDGEADAAYRIRIQNKASLTASGEPESIISILMDFYGATSVIYIPGWPSLPASYYIISDSTITLAELISYTPSGVKPLIIESLKWEDDDPVEFEDGTFLYVNKQ